LKTLTVLETSIHDQVAPLGVVLRQNIIAANLIKDRKQREIWEGGPNIPFKGMTTVT
jgi:hypothetical protein